MRVGEKELAGGRSSSGLGQTCWPLVLVGQQELPGEIALSSTARCRMRPAPGTSWRLYGVCAATSGMEGGKKPGRRGLTPSPNYIAACACRAATEGNALPTRLTTAWTSPWSTRPVR